MKKNEIKSDRALALKREKIVVLTVRSDLKAGLNVSLPPHSRCTV
jgi:hypothetical protein